MYRTRLLKMKFGMKLKTKMDVISVYRFRRRISETETQPSGTVKIGFRSLVLPKTLKMFNSIVTVELYVPPYCN